MKNIFKKKKPEKTIPYCKKCIYWIEYSSELHEADSEREDGRDICGYSFSAVINEIGNEVFRTYGEKEFCSECGMLLNDTSKPVYLKCKGKNKNNNCKDFKQIDKKFYLKEWVKRSIIAFKEMVYNIRISKFSLSISWLVFHSLFLLYFWGKIIATKPYIAYLIITISIFYYLAKKSK